MKTTSRLLLRGLAATTLGGASLHAAAVIHEPFEQPAGSLGGQAGGTGLNTWSVNQAVNVVETPSLTYGDLVSSGGQAELPNNSGVDAWVTTTSVLADNGLLADGATLWFSYMHEKSSSGGANEKAGFAFGSERLDGAFNGTNMSGSGNGLGVLSTGTTAKAAAWSGGGQQSSASGGGHTITLGQSIFLVGKIEWGATAGDDETITLYSPSTSDLGTLGTGFSATMAGVDQTAFDTVSFTQRNSGGTQIYDEIRFGATFEDVAPVPEPSIAILGGLGLFGLLRRRR